VPDCQYNRQRKKNNLEDKQVGSNKNQKPLKRTEKVLYMAISSRKGLSSAILHSTCMARRRGEPKEEEERRESRQASA
jgi:hypothetical protein